MARGIQVTGVRELQAKLKRNATLDDVKRVVRTNTTELNGKIQRKTQEVYTGHWEGGKFVSPTGASKRSVIPSFSSDALTGNTGLGMEYNPYLEKGTRFMTSRPVVGPCFRVQLVSFKRDLKRLVN